MEFWEFLIQKEGDRSWLPLESPSVEILEGRYRVVARSSRVSTTTEIRVTHHATDVSPPVRRIRKRTSQTNPDGLFVILPFTQLLPGTWELHCTSDLMAEMLGEGWQSTVQLDVLPLESSGAEAWDDEPDSQLAALPAGVSGEDSEAKSEETGEQLPEAAAEAAQFTERSAAELAESEPALTVDAWQPEAQQNAETAQPAAPEYFEEGTAADPLPESGSAATSADLESPQPASDGQPLIAPVRVVLEHETFVIQRGETLMLTGRVEPEESSTATAVPITELRVQLYDPQTSRLLMDEAYPVGGRLPPFPFSGTVSLPEHYQTYLVLGEIIFKGITAAGTPVVVATQSFNVTTDLHELIEAIANDFPDAEALPPEAILPPTQAPRPKASPSRSSSLPLFSPTGRQPLPPQLRPAPGHRDRTLIQLPPFLTPSRETAALSPDAKPAAKEHLETASPQAAEPGINAAAEIVAAELEGAPANGHVVSTESVSESISAVEASSATPAEAPELSTAAPKPQPAASRVADSPSPPRSKPHSKLHSKPGVAAPPSPIPPPIDLLWDRNEAGQRVPVWRRTQETAAATPEESSFRALNLQNRFWSRLQALVADTELSSWLELQHPLEGTPTADSLTPPDAPPLVRSRSNRPLGLDASLAAQEVVVEDVDSSGGSHPAAPGATEQLPVLAEDEPVPMPRLQIPQNELVAGQPLTVTVKLPHTPSRLQVKLWLRDRQTRSLLGTPCWLSNFTPDGLGSLVGRSELTIPGGCLEVQFEAITIEVVSQRESDKTTLSRAVVPPDLSTLSFNELEI